LKLDLSKCNGCGLCEEVCPLGILRLEKKKVHMMEGCVNCRTCLRVCPKGVFSVETEAISPRCDACPVMCSIPEGGYGACKRYKNVGGTIKREARVISLEEVKRYIASKDPVIQEPLITGIGSGTTYPDFRPSPIIVSGVRSGIDVVTVVTEAPLSYSGLKVKIDTDQYIGVEGKRVFLKGKGRRQVGHLCTEEYGSKILSLGGVNILTSKHGIFAAKAIYELLLGKEVVFVVEDGAELLVQIGNRPLIGGKLEERMRVGCGSATTGLFAPLMAKAADEVIVLDGHITALFTEHPCGRYLGVKPSGISLKGRKSTDGRYFLEKGEGWGGTDIKDPLEVIGHIDSKLFKKGFTLLITETTGERWAYYEMTEEGLKERELKEEAKEFLKVLKESCEPTRVSGVFSAGVGGSARAGVTKNPIKLTRAVHRGEVEITIGGARPFIFPGGGINFLVNVEEIRFGSIYLTPTPSFVLPIEYTMRLETFKAIGGHLEAIRPLEAILKKNPQ